MFMSEAINVPVLGIIENMAYFTPEELPENKYYIFGKEGARNLAEDLVGHFQVKDAVTAENLNETEFTKAPRSLIQRGYDRTRSGDIALIYESGIIEPIFSDHTGTTHGSPYNYDTQVPLLWYGWNIKHGNTTRKIDITDIAPTVSTFLHINLPSGCTGVVIEELFK